LRNTALIARRIAKALVQTGAAKECRVTLVVFPGDEKFSIISMIDDNRPYLETERWARMFDLSPTVAGNRYTGDPDLVEVARHGHFTNAGLAWERVLFDDSRV
jgi:S-adenosylmethionine synthetase